MTLPADLLQAVSSLGGGKITLVIGAGSSFEAPTSIPLARQCSTESHTSLIADGVLATGDCTDPSDLSCLADAVFTRTGAQRQLVQRLSQRYSFKSATPNDGHKVAAALLREGAVNSVVTLNFDLALSAAISELGVGDEVAVIDGPEDLPSQKTVNLYYLHRNANAADPESWILRTTALNETWRNHWEEVVATKVLLTPVVVFVGLGSPAAVLIECSKRIQAKIPAGNKLYQVDPGDPNSSTFFAALGLDRSAFIPLGWCDFMEALSQRLLVEQVAHIGASAAAITLREQLATEDISALLDRVREIGLVNVGRLRSNWLTHDKPYQHDDPVTRELVADLLIAIAMIERETGTAAALYDDGVVEFQRNGRIVSSYICISGRGTASMATLESRLSAQRRKYRSRARPPSGAIISATSDGFDAPLTPPTDVIFGDTSTSIIAGPAARSLFHIASLRSDPTQCQQVAP